MPPFQLTICGSSSVGGWAYRRRKHEELWAEGRRAKGRVGIQNGKGGFMGVGRGRYWDPRGLFFSCNSHMPSSHVPPSGRPLTLGPVGCLLGIPNVVTSQWCRAQSIATPGRDLLRNNKWKGPVKGRGQLRWSPPPVPPPRISPLL
jgi:hypothetical protein